MHILILFHFQKESGVDSDNNQVSIFHNQYNQNPIVKLVIELKTKVPTLNVQEQQIYQ